MPSRQFNISNAFQYPLRSLMNIQTKPFIKEFQMNGIQKLIFSECILRPPNSFFRYWLQSWLASRDKRDSWFKMANQKKKIEFGGEVDNQRKSVSGFVYLTFYDKRLGLYSILNLFCKNNDSWNFVLESLFYTVLNFFWNLWNFDPVIRIFFKFLSMRSQQIHLGCCPTFWNAW